jgi:predicted deacetylase
MMRIAIRMDDITPDMDWDKFNKFKTILDRYGVKPLIGVVPDNQDPKLSLNEAHEDFWDYIKELQNDGWTIAMHGLSHLYTTKEGGMFPLNHKSEFAGYSYDKQCEMISKGKELLASHGIYTDIFMAPSHSYDVNTIEALKKNGFTKITDGFGYEPYERYGMTFYPISANRGSVLKSSRDGAVTFVVHTNTMKDKEFDYYEQVCQNQSMISYRDLFRETPVRRGIFGALRERLMASAKYTLVRLRSK